MENKSKILTLINGLVVIFLLLGLAGISLASSKYYPKEEGTRNENQDPVTESNFSSDDDSLGVVECEKIPPHFENLDPYPGQKDVERTSSIKFSVFDGGRWWEAGKVDTDSVYISIETRFWKVEKQKPRFLEFVRNGYGVHCEYTPEQPFDWSDKVTVSLHAADWYYQGSADTVYTFYIVQDEENPTLEAISPKPEEKNVSTNANIIINGSDKGRGVDLENVIFRIDGVAKQPKISGNPWEFAIDYTPDSSWNYSATVHIICTAYDLDGNEETLEYRFETKAAPDTTPPRFVDMFPGSEERNVLRETLIKFTVVDDSAGVDIDRVFISITNRQGQVDNIQVVEFEKFALDSVRFTYTPEDSFDWSDVVEIILSAYDLAKNPNLGNMTYTFYTVRDDSAPELTPVFPVPETINIKIDTAITIHCTDIGRGVDLSNLILKIDSADVTPEPFDNPWDFNIVYTPETNWSYDDSIHVHCTVNDLDSNTATINYWFKTEAAPDITAPWFVDLTPGVDELNVPRETLIEFTVVDDKAGVNTDRVFISITDRRGQVDEIPVVEFEKFRLDSIRFTYTPEDSFDWSDVVKITLSASDLAEKPNSDSTTYSFYTVPDLFAPVLTPISPQPEAEDVNPNLGISIKCVENERSVKLESLTLKVDGVDVQPKRFPESLTDFLIVYKPDANWAFNKVVRVLCSISDIDGNVGAKEYWFKTKAAPAAPRFVDLVPAIDENEIPRESSISFTVVDDDPGVDTDRVFISITGRQWKVENIKLEDFELVNGSPRFTYQPNELFDWSDDVEITLSAYDFAPKPNLGDTTYKFYTVRDSIAPTLEAISPKHKELKVPPSTGITIHGTDVGRGIDLDNITLKINKVDKQPFVSDNPWDFEIKLDSIWSYGETVNVFCEVHDLDGNLATLEYWFRTEGAPDELAPWFVPLSPDTNAQDVDHKSIISFKVFDDNSGVDTSSIKITVKSNQFNDINIKPGIVGYQAPDLLEVTCEYQPTQPFAWNDTVYVTLSAYDLCDSVKKYGKLDYKFYIKEDHEKPTAEIIAPDTLTMVPLSQSIEIKISDNISGVDINSITFSVIGDSGYSSNNCDVIISEEGKIAHVIHKPGEPYHNNEKITVELTAKDNAGNKCSLNESFTTTDKDVTPPIVFDHNPPIFGKITNLTHSIQFKVKDDMSGVNEESISVSISINGGEFEQIGLMTDLVDNCVHVTCFQASFDYNDTVFVKIEAEDNIGNHTDITGTEPTVHYYFTVPQDITPPMVANISRAQLDTQQDPFNISITDDISGVDYDNLQMLLWSEQEPDIKEIDVSSCIRIIDDRHVEIEYSPVSPYLYNDYLSFKIIMQDNAGNKSDTLCINAVATPNRSPDLFFINLISSVEEEVVKVEREVFFTAYISNDHVDCNESFDIRFYLDNSEEPFYETTRNGLRVGEVITIETQAIQLKKEGQRRITARIDEEDNVTEDIESNNGAEVQVEVEGAKLIVRSNPFTPNNDGINDEAVFDFSQFEMEQPKLVIFDIHGKLIKEFTVPTEEGKFRWYGCDKNGRPLLPDIYFYVLLDNNNPETRGCVVIIK